jgi:cyclopropane fatty-acyl-phospholipid synthase-like methyltransferase
MSESFEQMPEAGFSPACERNKDVILDILLREFADCRDVLEIGSGTGQHIVHFARAMPDVSWQPTDQASYLPRLMARLKQERVANVAAAEELDVRMQDWPVTVADGIFSANTLHYMSTACVEHFFKGIGKVLRPGGVLVVYGPFRYQGEFTSESNRAFDATLRQGDPERGIRDFEWLQDLAAAQQLMLSRDVPMPANNQTLVWRKGTRS